MNTETNQAAAPVPQIPQQAPAPLPGAPSTKVFSRIGFSLAAFITVQQLVAMVVVGIVSVSAPELMQTDWFGWVVSYLPLYLVAFPVMLLVLRTAPEGPAGNVQLHKLTLWGFVRVFLASAAVTFAISYITNLINTWAGVGLENATSDMMVNSNPWVNLFFACVVAPVMEEILFRQLLYKRLAPYGGKVFILFSALMFALLHPNLFQLFYAFLLGVLFAGLRYFTGKLWPCIAMHVAVNFLGSGLPVLLLGFVGGNEDAIMQLSLVLMLVHFVLIALGLVVIVHWLAVGRKQFALEAGTTPVPKPLGMLLNPGVVVYVVLIAIVIVVSMMPQAAM